MLAGVVGGAFSDKAGTRQEARLRTTECFYRDASTQRACWQVVMAGHVQGRCFGCVAAPVIGQTCGDLASRGAGAAVPQPLPSALMRSGTSVLGSLLSPEAKHKNVQNKSMLEQSQDNE